jgi:predicted dehydrogenase
MSDIKIKVLQIGAGSMGTRRMRDLCARGDVEVALFDARQDRRERAQKRFGISTFGNISEALRWGPNALSISTPPDKHWEYVELALENEIHGFSEANIWTYDYKKVEKISKEKGIVTVASSSLVTLPVVQALKKLVSEELGDLHAYGISLSTYLPTWHPGEGREYYARNRETSAAREMVPFELGYLNEVFGIPEAVAGYVGKRGNLQDGEEDTWCLQFRLDNGAAGQVTVSMGCPVLIRKGWACGTNGYIEFDISTGEIYKNFPEKEIEEKVCYGAVGEVLEKNYYLEISNFIEKIKGIERECFSYKQSAIVTAVLAASEKSAVTGRIEQVDIGIQPAELPHMY